MARAAVLLLRDRAKQGDLTAEWMCARQTRAARLIRSGLGPVKRWGRLGAAGTDWQVSYPDAGKSTGRLRSIRDCERAEKDV